MQGNVLGQNNLISKSSKDINFFPYKYIEKDISGIYSTGDNVREISDILNYVGIDWTAKGKGDVVYGIYRLSSTSYLAEFNLKTLQVNAKKLTNFSWDSTNMRHLYLDNNFLYITYRGEYSKSSSRIYKINLQTLESEYTQISTEIDYYFTELSVKYGNYIVPSFTNQSKFYMLKQTTNGYEFKQYYTPSGVPDDGFLVLSNHVYTFKEISDDGGYYYDLGLIDEIYNETNTITGPFYIFGSTFNSLVTTLKNGVANLSSKQNIIRGEPRGATNNTIFKIHIKNNFCLLQPIFSEEDPNISTHMNFQCYCNEDASIIYTGRYQNKIGLLIADK